ncbi:cupin-like domain-containing protein [Sphingomonas bacterium]|uniref:cupin-like domain-containing protein n=1 Tax=Sphingomonas bacterium TaxID=1895847 RepID=UPI0026286290|nr:cupin-like domain-containing protein [Sphingomonas bacterium]MDB5678664.1 Glutamine phosphoribosylpyrophosphate amidotransferase [Sphingomonas bacterium]
MTALPTIDFSELQQHGLAALDRPTLVTGADQATVTDADFLADLHAQRFPVVNNYLDDLLAGRTMGSNPRPATLGAYLAAPRPAADSGSALELMTEAPVPQTLLDRLALPATLLPIREARLFAGRRGSFTDMHFDWSSHWLFQVALFGRKHFAFLPLPAAEQLDPRGNFARRDLRAFSVDDWATMVADHGGYHCIIGPGEMLIQPPFWWHAVTYLDDAASVSIGLGPTDALVDDIVRSDGPRDWRLAALLKARLDNAPGDGNRDRTLEAIRAAGVKRAARRSA